MLNVYLGDLENVIEKSSLYFKNTYDQKWFQDPFIQEMILDVDKSKVIDGELIQSPVLGYIPPTTLSGGVKTLILIWERPDKIFNASNCGDNCAKWLLEMGERRDVTVKLEHLMNFGEGEFEFRILNNNAIIHNMKDFVMIGGDYLLP